MAVLDVGPAARAPGPAPTPRPTTLRRDRLLAAFNARAERPLLLVCAPAGYGKTTAVAQWLEHSRRPYAWLSLDARHDDPRSFVGRLLAALDHTAGGEIAAAREALRSSSDLGRTVVPLIAAVLAAPGRGPFTIMLDDYHAVAHPACHELVCRLIDTLPVTASVVIATRTAPPLRLARRRASGHLAEIGPQELRFAFEETRYFLNGPAGLALSAPQIEQIDERANGWAAGLTLIAAALAGQRDRSEFLDAMAASRAPLEAYLVEEVLETARPELQNFLCRTSILGRLSAPLCAALLEDSRAAELLDEVRRDNLFVTALDPDGRWVRYHHLFAETLARLLERREPALVATLHLRAASWFEEAGMPDEAIEHALAAGDGPAAASLLAEHWVTLIDERRCVALRQILDRLPPNRGELGPFCEALDLLCLVCEGVDQRLVFRRAGVLASLHESDARVRMVVDMLLTSPFYGDVGRAVELGRAAWERYAENPDIQQYLVVLYALVLWFAGDHDEVHALLDPRVMLKQPPSAAVWTRAILALVAADEHDPDLAVRYAREAMDVVKTIGAETAPEFTAVPWVLGEALRQHGQLDEARVYLDRGLEAESRRPGSIGHALALIYDAQLALAEGEPDRARVSAARARTIVDRYPDPGTLTTRLAQVETALDSPPAETVDPVRLGQNTLLGTRPTPAEMRVLELLDSERTLREIAEQLFLSLHTVKSHTRRLNRRLGTTTRHGAVALARERGLLE